MSSETQSNSVTKAVQSVASPKDQQRYRTIIADMVTTIRVSEAQTVDRYWALGKQFQAFEDFAKQTGNIFTHQQFIADLAQEGHPVGSSTLYFARDIVKRYPNQAILVASCDRGLTLTHLKTLLSLDAATLEKVEGRLVLADGSLLSTRDLQEVVEQHRSAARQEKIEAAMAPAAAAPKPTAKQASDTPTSENWLENEESETQVEGAPSAELKTPEKGEKPESAGTTGGSDKGFTKSPIGVYVKTDKAAYKLIEQLADAFIAVREMDKIGYNSDVAHGKAKSAMKDMRATLKTLAETSAKLLAAIDELGTDV